MTAIGTVNTEVAVAGMAGAAAGTVTAEPLPGALRVTATLVRAIDGSIEAWVPQLSTSTPMNRNY
jgi:hypothetical protein